MGNLVPPFSIDETQHETALHILSDGHLLLPDDR